MVGRVATLTVKSGALNCELATDDTRDLVRMTNATPAINMRITPTVARRCCTVHRRCLRVRRQNDINLVQSVVQCDPDEPLT